MTQINFGSTYRIKVTQAGINQSKKDKLHDLTIAYNGLVGKGNNGYARVSVPDSEDEIFIQKLKSIGYKIFQKFEGENIPHENLDKFIKKKLDLRDYKQYGKNMKRMSQEMKKSRRYEKSFDMASTPKKADIPEEKPFYQYIYEGKVRQSEDYLRIRKQYGEEFADAVFFANKKS